jgi:hypothetical protein
MSNDPKDTNKSIEQIILEALANPRGISDFFEWRRKHTDEWPS